MRIACLCSAYLYVDSPVNSLKLSVPDREAYEASLREKQAERIRDYVMEFTRISPELKRKSQLAPFQACLQEAKWNIARVRFERQRGELGSDTTTDTSAEMLSRPVPARKLEADLAEMKRELEHERQHKQSRFQSAPSDDTASVEPRDVGRPESSASSSAPAAAAAVAAQVTSHGKRTESVLQEQDEDADQEGESWSPPSKKQKVV